MARRRKDIRLVWVPFYDKLGVWTEPGKEELELLRASILRFTKYGNTVREGGASHVGQGEEGDKIGGDPEGDSGLDLFEG